MVVARDKDLTCDLLQRYHICSKVLSKARNGMLGLMGEMVLHIGRLLPIIRTFRPHIMLQIGGTFVGPAGRLTRVPTWAFTDTENATLSNAITFPLISRVFTPKSYNLNHGRKHIRYPGFHELAYLHPRRFEPDPSVLAALGMKTSDPFFIVRFVGWQSAHDIRQKGLRCLRKIQLVSELTKYGKVFISSEGPLPDEIKPYASAIPVHEIHHFMAFATLVVGESATMASEAATLGTPAIFMSPTGRGYTDVQEHTYGLVFNFKGLEQGKALGIVKELVERSYPKDHWLKKRQRLLNDSIDVTGWLVEMVEHFGRTHDADVAAQWALGKFRLEGGQVG